MKYTLFTIVIAAALSACSEKAPEPVAAPSSAPAALPPVASAAPLTLPSDVRPATLPPVLQSTDQCSIDRINEIAAKESTAITDKSKLTLHGWAADVAAGALPKEVYLELDGPSKQYVKATIGGARPDVADHFKKPSLGTAGWDVTTNLTGLANGSYVLRMLQLKADNTGTVCDTARALVLG